MLFDFVFCFLLFLILSLCKCIWYGYIDRPIQFITMHTHTLMYSHLYSIIMIFTEFIRDLDTYSTFQWVTFASISCDYHVCFFLLSPCIFSLFLSFAWLWPLERTNRHTHTHITHIKRTYTGIDLLLIVFDSIHDVEKKIMYMDSHSIKVLSFKMHSTTFNGQPRELIGHWLKSMCVRKRKRFGQKEMKKRNQISACHCNCGI